MRLAWCKCPGGCWWLAVLLLLVTDALRWLAGVSLTAACSRCHTQCRCRAANADVVAGWDDIDTRGRRCLQFFLVSAVLVCMFKRAAC
jgi:hypothetical protein